LNYTESLLNDEHKLSLFDTDANAFTPEFQLCVMDLLSQGVGVHHINNVI